jgi:precorrin-6B methylase 1
MKEEINRKEILLEKEKEKIVSLNEKYNKLIEILKYYEETPYSINQKLYQNEKNKEKEKLMKNLTKKKKIIKHSRLSMKNSFVVEIEKQKKYIEHLNKTISSVDEVLKSLD